MAAIIELLEPIYERALNHSVDRVRGEVALYAQLPREEMYRRVGDSFDAIFRDVREGVVEHYPRHMRNLSYQRSRQGVALFDIQQAVRIVNAGLIETVRATADASDATLIDAIDLLHLISQTGMIALYDGYEQAQLEVIESQQSAIQELSTPIIPMYEGILVLPIVGSIDSRRAGQIMEGLLEGISAHTADVVILDITGVPVIDTGVANYLLQSARAARLLGSTVVLVGIGAEIAQTVVQLGIDLAGIVTRANLQSGIEFALAQQGLAIQPIAQA